MQKGRKGKKVLIFPKSRIRPRSKKVGTNSIRKTQEELREAGLELEEKIKALDRQDASVRATLKRLRKGKPLK